MNMPAKRKKLDAEELARKLVRVQAAVLFYEAEIKKLHRTNRDHPALYHQLKPVDRGKYVSRAIRQLKQENLL